jgi:hypothetical protein
VKTDKEPTRIKIGEEFLSFYDCKKIPLNPSRVEHGTGSFSKGEENKKILSLWTREIERDLKTGIKYNV